MSSTDQGRDLVAFEISPELRQRVEAALAELRAAPDPKTCVPELVGTVLEMTDVGLDYFYLRPLEEVEAGLVARSTAKIGIAAAGKSLPLIVRRVVGSLSKEQLLELADVIEGMLVK